MSFLSVSSDGFGKDIWTIPFDKITRIIQVRHLHLPLDSYTP